VVRLRKLSCILVYLLPLMVFGSLLAAGCTVKPYATKDLSLDPSLPHFDPNDANDIPGVTLVTQGSKRHVTVRFNFDDSNDQTIKLPYHYKKPYNGNLIRIPVQINHTRYTALLDTGMPGLGLVTGDLVQEQKLAISSFGTHGQGKTGSQGICLVPSFRIGSGEIQNAIFSYIEQQLQWRFLNIPVATADVDVLLGVQFTKCFRYVLFDNINHTVVLSGKSHFKPSPSEAWTSWPFKIADVDGDERLIVTMPVAGETLDLMFDSCGAAPGLSLNTADWDRIKPGLNVTRLKNGRYLSWQQGRLPNQEARVAEFPIANLILPKALIEIRNREISMISLKYFKSVRVALDFANSRLWISNEESVEGSMP
jgi:hypothetical protein